MFTANSMNCLTEACLSLPGNGSTLATHSDRQSLFERAGRLVVTLAKRYYEENDESVLPRTIASFEAFENAMSLDIAMGGSTNTVLHLLAAANEARVDFTMEDIDRLSRKVPCLSKVAPAKSDVHMEDVHRAGGIMSILGELEKAGLLHTALPTVHSLTMGDALTIGTSGARRTTRCASSTQPHPAACRRRPPSASRAAGKNSTSTARTASFAAPSMPSARMAASPCFTATSRATAAS